jgi:PBP1b-binding outer membrane lipoprotein LpoB
MIKKILLMAIVLIVLAISGCTEDGAQIAENNTTDAPANVTDNVTANASEHEERQSVSIPLEKPPFIEDQ